MLTTSNADEAGEQQELSFPAGGNANGVATLEDTLAVSYRTKYTLTIGSANCTPWHLPKSDENLSPHRKLHTDACSSFS